MTAGHTFSDILSAIGRGWSARNCDECVLSLALKLEEIDPLSRLPVLASKEKFRFLWDGAPGRCIAASGRCQHLDLSGPRRFELAQRFSDTSLSRLIDVTPEAPSHALPRVLLAFAFFEETSERHRTQLQPPALQAILPRWQLSRQGRDCWLRLTAVATHEAESRELAERLWLMRELLVQPLLKEMHNPIDFSVGLSFPQQWQDTYKLALNRGIELVNRGTLDKLVLAVRQSISLEAPFNPLGMLSRLRLKQAGSCRFLWQRNKHDAFFGASPERLMSLRKRRLQIDALAGTASPGDNGQFLLHSDKDLREHELVVSSIIDQLQKQGLAPRRSRQPQLARHGRLLHLHSPIHACLTHQMPLHLAGSLHPTPAVAGFPRNEAMNWLRTLEPFERGCYAAPIGWLDSEGNAEFRVAIRCGHYRGHTLDLTAGAGLVRGSDPERELQEVGLKLAVLAEQLHLKSNII